MNKNIGLLVDKADEILVVIGQSFCVNKFKEESEFATELLEYT